MIYGHSPSADSVAGCVFFAVPHHPSHLTGDLLTLLQSPYQRGFGHKTLKIQKEKLSEIAKEFVEVLKFKSTSISLVSFIESRATTVSWIGYSRHIVGSCETESNHILTF